MWSLYTDGVQAKCLICSHKMWLDFDTVETLSEVQQLHNNTQLNGMASHAPVYMKLTSSLCKLG